MEKKEIKNILVGFLCGVGITLVAGLINYKIHTENYALEKKTQERKDKEIIVDQFAELESAYNQLKYTLRNWESCELVYKYLSTIHAQSIKLISNPILPDLEKLSLSNFNAELDFVAKNQCRLSDWVKAHGKPTSSSVDGKK